MLIESGFTIWLFLANFSYFVHLILIFHKIKMHLINGNISQDIHYIARFAVLQAYFVKAHIGY